MSHSPSSKVEEVRSSLLAAGLRPNSTRIGVLLYMREQHGLVTPDELYTRNIPGIPRSISVCYRVLAELCKAGLLKGARIGVGRSVVYTASDLGVGFIAFCVGCKSTVAVRLETFEVALREAAQEGGLNLMPGPFYFPAACDHCQGKRIVRKTRRRAQA